MELRTVTPAEAETLLATSAQAYRHRPRVTAYAEVMKAGQWEPDPQVRAERWIDDGWEATPPVPVTIRDGLLWHGNHRLAAIVEAGVAVTLMVEET